MIFGSTKDLDQYRLRQSGSISTIMVKVVMEMIAVAMQG
jgi:hypothetical protein